MFYIEKLEKYPNYTIFTTALLLSVIVYIPLWNAQFWVIDDHEIIAMRQTFIESKVGLWQSLYDMLLATEVGHFPNGSRFRPFYYFVRIVKSILFENNSTVWFIFQTTVFFMALLAFGQAIKNTLPTAITALAMVLLASLPFNLDMWSRLGPGENGAFFFFMLFFLGLSRLGKNTWAWPICCLAATAAMGYKENFILLILPLFAGYYYTTYVVKHKPSLLWTIVPCLMSILLAIVFINILRGSASHVYAASTSPESSIHIAIAYFTSFHFIACVLSILPIFFAKYFLEHEYHSPNIKKEVKLVFVVFWIVIILSCGNYVFYQGHIPIYMRYSFPYLFFLIIPSLLTASFYLHHLKSHTLVKKFGVCCIVVLLLLTTYAQGKIFLHSLKQAAETQSFHRLLSIGKKAETLILVNTGQPIHLYEPYFSLKRFSKAGLTAPEILYFPLFFLAPDSPLNEVLETTLKQEATKYKEPSSSDENILLVTYQNGAWKTIDIYSNERNASDIPTEIETTENSTKIHFFLLASKQPIVAFQLTGRMPDETVFSINGSKLAPENVTLTPEKALLTLVEKDLVIKPLTLYIITLEFNKKSTFQHLQTKILVKQQN